jgi:predicted RNA binding protein YcfA (HicA-like mRNA interferase family)
MPSPVRYSTVRKMLEAKGWRYDHATGSHHIFVKPGKRAFSVPVHKGLVKYGYVRAIEKFK